MRGRAAKNRRALKRERAKYHPAMPFRAYVKAYEKMLEQDAINRERNAIYAQSYSRNTAP